VTSAGDSEDTWNEANAIFDKLGDPGSVLRETMDRWEKQDRAAARLHNQETLVASIKDLGDRAPRPEDYIDKIVTHGWLRKRVEVLARAPKSFMSDGADHGRYSSADRSEIYDKEFSEIFNGLADSFASFEEISRSIDDPDLDYLLAGLSYELVRLAGFVLQRGRLDSVLAAEKDLASERACENDIRAQALRGAKEVEAFYASVLSKLAPLRALSKERPDEVDGSSLARLVAELEVKARLGGSG